MSAAEVYLFASDVHLNRAREAQVAAFERFLDQPCRDAEAVFLLGDVFDAWLGDDDARDPHPRIEAALTSLTGSGTRVVFAHGNHDFLAGVGFAQRTGCEMVTQPHCVDIHGRRVVVLHGDQLCTRDEDYQRWRATFTDATNQQQFLALPFAAREQQAQALRLESAERKTLKPQDIMDVTPEAVTALLDECGAEDMVHGHTHRPAHHPLDGGRNRWVLGDWYEGDTVLRWDGAGPRLVSAASLRA